MYNSYGSRDCPGGPRCIFHPSFNVVGLVRTVFAVPGVCKTETGIRWFSAMFDSTVDTNS